MSNISHIWPVNSIFLRVFVKLDFKREQYVVNVVGKGLYRLPLQQPLYRHLHNAYGSFDIGHLEHTPLGRKFPLALLYVDKGMDLGCVIAVHYLLAGNVYGGRARGRA
jgi:hypothetical protein